jgi:hypothetical protein
MFHHPPDHEICLQSLNALASPSVVGMSPLTPPLPVLKRLAEVMFLIKISPLPSSDPREIVVTAFESSKINWRMDMKQASDGYKFLLLSKGVILACGLGLSPSDAEADGFRSLVNCVLKSDYCIITRYSEKEVLRLFETADEAPSGAFRYDLLCDHKLLPRSLLPVCERCKNMGHVFHFCRMIASGMEKDAPSMISNQSLILSPDPVSS